MSLTITEKEDGNKVVIGAKGFIDTSTSAVLENAIRKYADAGKLKIIVDLSGSDFVSSAGWGVMVASLKKIRGAGGDIKLAAMADKVEKVYKLMEFDSLIDHFPSVDAATKAF